jgi:hypothetical protein
MVFTEKYFGYNVPSKTSCAPCPPGIEKLTIPNMIKYGDMEDVYGRTYCGYE